MKTKFENLEMTDKIALKAKIDIVLLDMLHSEMGMDKIMEISKEAFDIIATRWNDWLQGRISK